MSEKKKELIRSLKFVLFSISAGVIQVLTFTLLEEVLPLERWLSGLVSGEVEPVVHSVANFVALVASVLWNFTLNRKFTFHSASNVPLAMLLVALFYVVFTPLSTWWTAVLTGPAVGWNEYLVLALTMIVNFVTEYLYDRFIVFGKSIDTAK